MGSQGLDTPLPAAPQFQRMALDSQESRTSGTDKKTDLLVTKVAALKAKPVVIKLAMVPGTALATEREVCMYVCMYV